jgi:hypothetical protein
VVFVYGSLSRGARQTLRGHHVPVRRLSSYAAALRRRRPRTWRPLAAYPVLHKWLSLSRLPRTGITQLLYVDCDTFFAGDVAALFDRYAAHDWYAREEPCTARSPWGARPGYFDESAFGRLAAALRASVVPPYNLGVCLMNNGVWRGIARRQATLLSLVYRLLPGLAGRPGALPYPSSNPWIVEQVAMWLVLGTIPRFSHGLFSWRDVLQGEEFESYAPAAAGTVCHYFSKHQDRLAAWLAR